ncbi:ankyrin repeat domain-containing protein 13D isoform X7 [Phycodurus eques]|uniref:ankyrin repeat domain-containing protein 13D isoform X7 n=1 Tax=Phycodurus eques TaxID=693459 RepID=UPI002ACE2615|nr:ankyrin repeat domain-containing protein 13D isoform X7 [Phycodurus eques]
MAQEQFPLHFLVWNNQYQELDQEMQNNEQNLERVDPRGRTPLELAVSLGHLESTRVLLRYTADPTHCNAQGWTILQEAVSTGDPELVQLVLQYRDFKRATERLAGIPELLSKLRQARDFYVEMKWEFTSWGDLPLVSKVCPSDVYRVWKSGSCLRVDTTLLGFEHMTWLKGRRSYIFKGGDNGAVVMEVDHEKQVVYTEPLVLSPRDAPSLLAAMLPSQENTAQRLTSPIVSTHLNTRNIAFERNKSGIWGWRSEKSEMVSGYEAKVYSATNVELVTRSRTEHLSDQDKSRSKGSKTPLQSFLGIAEQHTAHNGTPMVGTGQDEYSGTVDQLYTLGRVLEGAWEFAQPVYMCFVDLEKAFDRVPRGVLWRVLRKYGVSYPLIRAIRSLYDRSQSLVRISGSKSDSFPVRVGLCQGCPLSPILFITFMDRISRRSRGEKGVRFGGLGIASLLFADDVVLLASSNRDLQLSLEQYAAECEAAGMRINTSRSEIMVLSRKRLACPLQVWG